MKNRKASLIVLVLLAAACGGSDGSAGPAGASGKDGANGSAGNAGSNGTNGTNGSKGDPGTDFDAGLVPTHAPAGITFEDRDPSVAITEGLVHIQHAANESDVTSYAVYWGFNATDKIYLEPIFEVKATGDDLYYPMTATPPLGGGGTLLVFSKNAAGEMATGASVTLGSGGLVSVDIASGQGLDSGYFPTIAIDETNQKVLVVTDDAGKPGLFICDYDGTGCTFKDISDGTASGSGYTPSLALDPANGKLYVATTDLSNSIRPTVFRCNLDGTSCTHADVSAGLSNFESNFPTMLVDSTNAKIDVIVQSINNSSKPALIRCNLDMTGCSLIDISASQGADCGDYPTAMIDTVNGQLLVATTNDANSGKPGLFICHLDGTSCAHHDISASAGASSGYKPAIALDSIHGRIDVLAQNSSTNGALLFHCSIDGLACERSDPFQGGMGQGPTVAFDPTTQKIVSAGAGSLGVNVSRCDSSGLNCSHAASDVLKTPRIGMSSTGRYWIASQSFGGHPMLTFVQ